MMTEPLKRPEALWRVPLWTWFGGSTSIVTWVRICTGDFPR